MVVEFRWIWIWHSSEHNEDTGIFAVSPVWFATYEDALDNAFSALEDYPFSGIRLCIETHL